MKHFKPIILRRSEYCYKFTSKFMVKRGLYQQVDLPVSRFEVEHRVTIADMKV